MQPANHHLAELNVGRLIAPTGDPRAAEFMEALDRLNHLLAEGDSDRAFGWSYLKDAHLWKMRNCNELAAE